MPAFRINAAQIFLTYPRANVTLDDLYEHLHDLELYGVKQLKLVVAEEKHQDGGIHFHAYIRYAKPINCRNAHLWDYKELHPNIQGCRSPKRVIDYVVKGGLYRSNFDIKLKRRDALAKLLDEINNPEQFVQEVIKLDPDYAISRFSNLRAFADYQFGKKSGLYDPIREFTDFSAVPDPIIRFRGRLGNYIRGERDMRSIWLWGPSRIGKTQLARSLGKHCYMQGIWNFKCLSDQAEYGVFDDISFESIKFQYKQLFGLQKNVNFTGKYQRPTTFEWGIPIIFISNELPSFAWDEQAWLDVNVDFVHVTHRLY